MKYKKARIIQAAISLAIVGLTCNIAVLLLNANRPLSASISQPTMPQPSQVNLTVAPVTALSYKIETYDSQVMGGSRTYGVSLPPGYEQNPTKHYPVIFLLHGGHGYPTDWFDNQKGRALVTLKNLYDEGKLPPSIIITPDGNDKRGSSPYWDPQYIDGKNGKVSTAIGEDLVSLIKSRYRTLPTPNFWAIGGYSSGGWGAMNVGLHHRNNFSILFSHSGYFRDKSGPQNSPLNYIRTISQADRIKLYIYLDIGQSDNEDLPENREFHTLLNRLKVANVFNEFPGAHTWSYWREHLADSLTFVGEQFKQAQS